MGRRKKDPNNVGFIPLDDDKIFPEIFTADKEIKINEDIVNDIMNNDFVSLKDREGYFVDLAINRLENCNSIYLRDFDDELDNIISDIDNFSLNDLSKLSRLSNKLCSDIYNNFITSLNNLANKGSI